MPEPPVPTLFERSRPGRRAGRLPAVDVPEQPIESLVPAGLLRQEPPGLPEVSEPELVRHFTALSRRNFAIDVGFYPLGSCTMKHNPRINERVAALPGFRGLHPLQRPEAAQGMLRPLHDLAQLPGETAGPPATLPFLPPTALSPPTSLLIPLASSSVVMRVPAPRRVTPTSRPASPSVCRSS